VSLSRKTSITLYISQRYKKLVQSRFSTAELGKENSEMMRLLSAPEGAECMWRWMANCSRSAEQWRRRPGHQSSNDAMTALREQTLTQNAAVKNQR